MACTPFGWSRSNASSWRERSGAIRDGVLQAVSVWEDGFFTHLLSVSQGHRYRIALDRHYVCVEGIIPMSSA